MDDHSSIDPAIVQETHESQPFQFGLGEDPIAAHKRMMKAAAEARPGDGRQNRSIPAGHIATSTLDPSQTTKISKQFNAADYLLPSKGSPGSRPDSTSDTSQLKQSSSHSRFQRFFGASQPDSIMQAVPGGRPIGPQKPLDSFDGLSAGLRSPPPKFDVDATDIPPQSLSGHPPGLVSPPPQDHASRLMGLLTSKVGLVAILSDVNPCRMSVPLTQPCRRLLEFDLHLPRRTSHFITLNIHHLLRASQSFPTLLEYLTHIRDSHATCSIRKVTYQHCPPSLLTSSRLQFLRPTLRCRTPPILILRPWARTGCGRRRHHHPPLSDKIMHMGFRPLATGSKRLASCHQNSKPCWQRYTGICSIAPGRSQSLCNVAHSRPRLALASISLLAPA